MSPMSVARIRLKQELALLRQAKNGINYCDLYHSPFRQASCQVGGTQLHELLIERDDVKGPEMLAKITESPENLQFLCGPCNMVAAKTKAVRGWLIGHQIKRFGRQVCRRLVPQGPEGLTPEAAASVVILAGWHCLEDWIEGLGMTDPKPYVRRLEAIAELLLEESVSV